MTETLAKQDDNDDDDEWIPSKAAGVCIMFLAQCCGDAIVDAILPFITQHFNNINWHYREAAIMAFGSIMEGPSKENLMRLVEQAISSLILTLSDNHLAVKDTAAWAIGRVCDSCEGLVTKQEILALLLPALSAALQDQPRVAANVCWVIILKNVKKKNLINYFLRQYLVWLKQLIKLRLIKEMMKHSF